MRSSPTAKPAMPPEAPAGEDAHFRALESLYAAAPINGLFEPRLTITAPGTSRIDFTIEPRHFHAAGAAHGTSSFNMLDAAAFSAENSPAPDRLLPPTARTAESRVRNKCDNRCA